MKINLRKANQLALDLHNKLKTIRLEPRESISLLTDPIQEAENASLKFVAKATQKLAATKALYDIRYAVGSMPRASQLLTKIAQLQAMEAVLVVSTNEAFVLNEDKLAALYQRASAVKETHYREDDTITGVLRQEVVEEFNLQLKALRKTVIALKAELFEYNVSTFIELSAETVKVLEDFDLI